MCMCRSLRMSLSPQALTRCLSDEYTSAVAYHLQVLLTSPAALDRAKRDEEDKQARMEADAVRERARQLKKDNEGDPDDDVDAWRRKPLASRYNPFGVHAYHQTPTWTLSRTTVLC